MLHIILLKTYCLASRITQPAIRPKGSLFIIPSDCLMKVPDKVCCGTVIGG